MLRLTRPKLDLGLLLAVQHIDPTRPLLHYRVSSLLRSAPLQKNYWLLWVPLIQPLSADTASARPPARLVLSHSGQLQPSRLLWVPTATDALELKTLEVQDAVTCSCSEIVITFRGASLYNNKYSIVGALFYQVFMFMYVFG